MKNLIRRIVYMRLLDLDITYENIDIIKSVNVDGIAQCQGSCQ